MKKQKTRNLLKKIKKIEKRRKDKAIRKNIKKIKIENDNYNKLAYNKLGHYKDGSYDMIINGIKRRVKDDSDILMFDCYYVTEVSTGKRFLINGRTIDTDDNAEEI